MDIRAVLLRSADEILLVQERVDGDRWTLPGGWADVGCTPFEVAEKEIAEETGLAARAVRLLALLDKRKHSHPPQLWYVYKAFVLCEVTGGALAESTTETTGARWTHRRELGALSFSTDRVTKQQIETMFTLALDPSLTTLCD